jgi:hypothetical protein
MKLDKQPPSTVNQLMLTVDDGNEISAWTKKLEQQESFLFKCYINLVECVFRFCSLLHTSIEQANDNPTQLEKRMNDVLSFIVECRKSLNLKNPYPHSSPELVTSGAISAGDTNHMFKTILEGAVSGADVELAPTFHESELKKVFLSFYPECFKQAEEWAYVIRGDRLLQGVIDMDIVKELLRQSKIKQKNEHHTIYGSELN